MSFVFAYKTIIDPITPKMVLKSTASTILICTSKKKLRTATRNTGPANTKGFRART